MDSNTDRHIDELARRYPQLTACKEQIREAYCMLEQLYAKEGKLLVCGNGGSASDSEHIVGELMKEFKLKREVYKDQADALKSIDNELGTILAQHLQGALPAITLTGHSSLTTAFMNDCMPELVFAQQVNGYGTQGDILLAISTSGNSRNVLFAAVAAKSKGMKVIGLTGNRENKLSKLSDVCIQVPEAETYKIQELHLPVYHCLCMMLEEHFFGKEI
jgi:D-sedoheptulose 7-phosphate isomerase